LLGECYQVEAAFATRSDSLGEAKRNKDTFDRKAEAAVKRAIQLDPNLPAAYVTQAFMEAMNGRFAAEEELLQKALALDPGTPDILNYYTFFLADVGRVNEVMPIRLQLQSVEPFVPTFNAATAGFLWLTGQNDASIAAFEAVTTLRGLRGRGLARAYATSGRYKEAADALMGIPPRVIESEEIVGEAAKVLRSAPAKLSATDALPDLRRLGWVYLYVGAPEEAIRYQERMASLNQFVSESSYEIWHADFAPLRRTERFKNFVRKSGLVAYWRAKGWPEFCRPATGDDFVCD
jgi:tetratricopeptide (TPR) repeat protein